MTITRTLLLGLLLIPNAHTLAGDPDSDQEQKAGTIRKYLWYTAGVVLPQVLAKYGFCSPEGANLCSVGNGLSAIGDMGEYESLQTIGQQAAWAGIAHELLRWPALSNLCQDSCNAVHGFFGKFSGNQVDAVSAARLNHTVATVGLGNLLRKLYEYW